MAGLIGIQFRKNCTSVRPNGAINDASGTAEMAAKTFERNASFEARYRGDPGRIPALRPTEAFVLGLEARRITETTKNTDTNVLPANTSTSY